jgi:hypothetical protein
LKPRWLAPEWLIAPFLILVLAGCGAPAPAEVDQTETTGEIILDNADPTVELQGPWQSAHKNCAYGGVCAWAPLWDNPADGTIDPGQAATAIFRPALPEPGLYEIYAWWCRAPGQALASKQRIWICASRGYSCMSVTVNPQQSEGVWNSLGTFYLETDADVTVKNSALELRAPPGQETIADGAVVVDAFKFTYRGQPQGTLTPVPWQPQPSPTATRAP